MSLNAAAMIHVQVKVKGSEETIAPASEAGSICWICGESASVEVEIRNPTVIPIKVIGLVLCLHYEACILRRVALCLCQG